MAGANPASAASKLPEGSFIMPSDHERETLLEIERGLLSEDPEFAQSFNARAQHLYNPSRYEVGTKIFLLAGLLISALMLVVGAQGGAVAFIAGTGLIWLAWRFGAGSHQQAPDTRGASPRGMSPSEHRRTGR
jgi:hypothetical protein